MGVAGNRLAKVCLRIALLDRIDDAEARATARITSLLEAWYTNPMRGPEFLSRACSQSYKPGAGLSRIRVLPVPPTGPTTSGRGVMPINTRLKDILQR